MHNQLRLIICFPHNFNILTKKYDHSLQYLKPSEGIKTSYPSIFFPIGSLIYPVLILLFLPL